MIKNLILASLPLLALSTTYAAEHNLAASIGELKQQQTSHFSEQTRTLAAAIEGYCVSPGGNNSSVTQAWRQAMLAWMPLQGASKGPINELNLAWSFQFWPDKKNITGRKINALLDQSASFTAQDLRQQSVVVRGLGALELLIYEKGLDNSHCALAKPISQLLEQNADTIEKAWAGQQGYAAKLLERAKSEEQKLTTELIAQLSHQLSFINKKFSLPLGKGGNTKPYQAESWRSETSMANLKASFNSMEVYFHKGIKQFLLDKGEAKLARQIEQGFIDLQAAWPKEPSMKKLLASDQGYRALLRSKIDIERLTYLIQESLPVKLKIVVGFNSTDGD